MLFLFHVCNNARVLPCNTLVTCWETADLLSFLYVMFSCVLVTFPYDFVGQLWHLIVSIPDVCLLFFFRPKWFQLLSVHGDGNIAVDPLVIGAPLVCFGFVLGSFIVMQKLASFLVLRLFRRECRRVVSCISVLLHYGAVGWFVIGDCSIG